MTDHDIRAMLGTLYERFNARDVDAVLAYLTSDVEWPNGWEGGYVHGHDEVRDYWTRQWGGDRWDRHAETFLNSA